jgi:cation/acetate symporter
VGGFLGLATAVGLTVVSKSVWVDVFHNTAAIFPYTSPALFSMTVGFVGVWLFSVTDKSPRAAIDKAGFEAQEVRSETGIGASTASAH